MSLKEETAFLSEPNAEDRWTVDGEIAFGMIPGGSTPITSSDAPICLHRGDQEWAKLTSTPATDIGSPGSE